MNLRLWQLALIGVSFGVLAAGSCAEAIDGPRNDLYAVAFLPSAVLAGGSLLLLAFRVPRSRREAWPGMGHVLLVCGAGLLVNVGTALWFASIINGPQVRKRELIVLLLTLLVTSAVAAVAMSRRTTDSRISERTADVRRPIRARE
jgi:hypothetical protein